MVAIVAQIMLLFLLFMFSAAIATMIHTSSASSFPNAAHAQLPLHADSQHQQQQQHLRILTNVETGTITHPLIPHKVHLERRRRELHEKYHGDINGEEAIAMDLSLPPRPNTSRHSSSSSETSSENVLLSHYLRKNNGHRALQQQMGALYQGYGTHYVDLWVGSPTPQRQTVIVDTGSGVTAFPCEECSGCGDDYHTDSYYRESQSTAFRPLTCAECSRGYCANMDNGNSEMKCRITMSYAEGSSWTAYEALDLCYAGGPHDTALSVHGPMTNSITNQNLDHVDPVEASQFAFELSFGCQISITGLFITQLADGIMGMENEDTSFWKQMYSKQAIPRPEFSLCFSRSNEANREGTGAGAMTLGGVDPRLHMSPMVYAKNVKGSGFYAVTLNAIYLRAGGGISAQTTQEDMASGRVHKLPLSYDELNRGNVIVDSGTTDTYFNRALDVPFKKLWKELTGRTFDHGAMELSEEELATFPTILLVLSGYEGQVVGDEPTGNPDNIAGYAGDTDLSNNPRDVVVAIPASHYFEFDYDTGKYVARVYTDEGSGSVLGANAMMGHDVYFDNARGRIGIAESNCDYVSLLLSEGTSVSVAPATTKESSKTEVVVPSKEITGDDDEEGGVDVDEEYDDSISVATDPDQSSENKSNESPYEVFEDKNVSQHENPGSSSGSGNNNHYGGGMSSMAAEIFDDMKHECSSAGCRGIAAFFIIGALLIVIAGIRRAVARRRVVRQYHEAELEISDLALDSDSDDEGGYVDRPQIT